MMVTGPGVSHPAAYPLANSSLSFSVAFRLFSMTMYNAIAAPPNINSCLLFILVVVPNIFNLMTLMGPAGGRRPERKNHH